MMFAGKQPGQPDPTISHDQEPLDPFTGELVFAGKQPGTPDPTVHSMPRRKGDELTPLSVNP